MATAFANLLISKKRTIGGIRIDGFIEENLTHSVRVTSNPIENGRDITDHVIIQPIRYSLVGIITDTPMGFAALSQLGSIVDSATGFFGKSEEGGITRSKQMYEELLNILNKREVITISSAIKKIENLVFESISVNVDKSTANAIFFNATFIEALILSSSTSSVSPERIDADIDKSAYSSPIAGGASSNKELDEVTEDQVFASAGS